MSASAAGSQGLRDIFETRIVPAIFAPTEDEEAPALVFLGAQPGAGASRATAHMLRDHPDLAVVRSADLRAFHPAFQHSDSAASGAESVLNEAVAGWLRDSIAYAREHHHSLLLDGPFAIPGVTFATAERFAAEGFSTRIVMVAVRRAESLLALASLYLTNVRAGRTSRFTDRATHDRGRDGTRALALEAERMTPVDRVTVLDRNGKVAFDAMRDDSERPFHGLSATLVAAQSERLTSLQSAQWLSELRHSTEFAMSLRNPPRPVIEMLTELHELALREIIPELPVPRGSRVIAAEERRHAANLVALRRLLPEERADVAAPVVTPAGPDRGGASL